ncbi:hypothetical protein J0A68_18370 [Algoriphagus sp. H41]|uniref:Uncharacterized protein n=1 Tax=Algoriphagus oliviformis TaxID=2811231 RepID=A0ABS3C7D8_9BACT|nr:hypothetical protein [Algoriphagus oliviformis]MBN7812928.1 hypothetical protein [Algoriphagus oliviformis]
MISQASWKVNFPISSAGAIWDRQKLEECYPAVPGNTFFLPHHYQHLYASSSEIRKNQEIGEPMSLVASDFKQGDFGIGKTKKGSEEPFAEMYFSV